MKYFRFILWTGFALSIFMGAWASISGDIIRQIRADVHVVIFLLLIAAFDKTWRIK